MELRIELTPELEQRLREEAGRNGQDVSAFTQSLLVKNLSEPSLENRETNGSGETLDQTLAGYLGLIDVSPSNQPETESDVFTEGLVEKYRKQGLTV